MAITALLLAAQPAHADAGADSRRQIGSVVESFRRAIVDKDKDGFMRLFLREDITWTGVYDDASLDVIMSRRKDKSLPRPKKLFGATPREFIESIAKAPERSDEIFDNVRIDTDGDVASVWFDYQFMRGAYRQNWGKEAWHMVRTENGWKIASVVWSMSINPEPPPPAATQDGAVPRQP